MSNPIQNRYDFVFIFDVKDGNPNGDPDQDNLPRMDIENQDGLVTDVCIKRKVRNYVQITKTNPITNIAEDRYGIFIQQGNILNSIIKQTRDENKNDKKNKKEDIETARKLLCNRYYDIRTFGAVLATGSGDEKGGAGTVRGPVQFTFSRSKDPIFQADHSITRCCVTTEEEAGDSQKEFASTFGRKSTVPYALYRMHGFISAVDAQKTGFSEDDLKLLWEALLNLFEHDRSAARGEMSARKLIIFKHGNHLGSDRSSNLFKRVKINKKTDVPRDFNDYEICIDRNNLVQGIEVIEK